MTDRPHWDDTWLEVAQVVARRSLCSRAQVGAVITDAEHRIVATGYNGPPRNFDHRNEPCTEWCERARGNVIEQSYANCPSLHAEANALMAADRSVWAGGTIYVTGHVCANCAKLIGNSGLVRVVVDDDGVNREYRQYEDTYRFLRALGVGVEVMPQQEMPSVDNMPRMQLHGKAGVIKSRGQWLLIEP